MLPFALLLGTMAGYFRGLVDDVITYVYTTLNSIPGVLLIASAVLIWLPGVYLIGEVFGTVSSNLMQRVAQKFIRDFRNRVYQKLQTQSLGYLQRQRTGDLMARAMGDVDELQSFIVGAIDVIIGEGLMWVLAVVIVMLLDWKVASASLAPLLIVYVLLRMFNKRVAPIYKRYTDVSTTILAAPGEIQLHLRAQAPSSDAAQLRVDDLVDKLETELGDSVFSDNGDSMEQIVSYYLQMRSATLSVAESCTGGLLAERLTSVSGSSRYFTGGAVVYSNDLKKQLVDVPADLLEHFGAVSEQVAKALAEGIRKRCGTTLGLGVTGVAGPTGGTAEKPVGLVYHALASESGTEVVQRNFAGDRQRIRWFASQQALDMVRRKLM